jgi:hypothetical protein
VYVVSNYQWTQTSGPVVTLKYATSAVALVMFSYWLVLPMVHHRMTFTRNIVAISLAVVLIVLLMMVFRQ